MNLLLREEGEIFRNGSRSNSFGSHIRDHQLLRERDESRPRVNRSRRCATGCGRRERSHITLADVIGPCSLVNEPRAIERRWSQVLSLLANGRVHLRTLKREREGGRAAHSPRGIMPFVNYYSGHT